MMTVSRLSQLSLLLFLAVVVWAGTGCSSDSSQRTTRTTGQTSEVPAYDSLLAAELGADERGMRRYVLALLKAGPNRDQDSTEAARLQQAHMANIRRMAEAGHLILAGPFLDEGSLQGLYLFDVPTVDSARVLTATDPAIQAGRLTMELHPWYGSAALMEVSRIHERIAKP